MKGVKDAWLPASFIGISFAIAQWITAATPAYNLTDVVGMYRFDGCCGALPALWKPRAVLRAGERYGLAFTVWRRKRHCPQCAWMALLPLPDCGRYLRPREPQCRFEGILKTVAIKINIPRAQLPSGHQGRHTRQGRPLHLRYLAFKPRYSADYLG